MVIYDNGVGSSFQIKRFHYAHGSQLFLPMGKRKQLLCELHLEYDCNILCRVQL